MKNQKIFKLVAQKGSSLYLAIILMSLLVSIAFGLSTLFLGQISVIKQIGNSVVALSAADAGIERVLLDREAPNLTPGYYSGSLAAATYVVVVSEGGSGNCLADYYCITSSGTYLGTRRAIEIIY
jgi:hypothetical protein